MITINTISATKFSFNGITYHKNFMPFVTGNKIAIINVYDGCITLTDAPTIYSDYTINGVTYGSVSALQTALLDVIYTRNSLIAAITGTGTTNYLPKFTGASTLGNSLIFDNGTNVGIGTTSPAHRLDVDGTIRGLNLRTVNGGSLFLPNPSNSFNWSLFNNSSNTLVFDFNGSQFVNITSSGNVGIGTTSPRSVSGFTTFALNNASNGGLIDFLNNGTLIGQMFNTSAIFDIGSVASVPLAFRTADSERMRIDQSGNVGIGTTAPTSKLHVVTDAVSGRQSLSNINRTTNNWLRVVNPQYSVDASVGVLLRVFPDSDARQGAGILASGGAQNGDTDLDLFVSNGLTSSTSYSALTIKGSTGNVGIGTTDPSEKLHVGGNGLFSGTVTASSFFASSDERLKDITSKDGDVITYKWKDGRDDKFHFGYSAQQTEKVNPYLVNKDDKGFLSVNYTEVLVLKVRELEKQVAELKSKLN